MRYANVIGVAALLVVSCASLPAWAQPAPQTTGHKQVAVDTRILKKYVGRYLVPPARVFTVTLEDGHLFTQMTGQGKIEVLPESEHDFLVMNLDAQLTFHTDATGNVTELVLHQGGDHPFKRIVEGTAESLHSQLAEVDSVIAAELAKHPVGSVTAGVVAGKQLIWSKSYGDADIEKKIPADADTVYRIGSITKMFTALMLEQLVDAGKVHLSDPVEKYFPEIKMVQGRFPDAPPITLVQLATHTSGLGREPDNTGRHRISCLRHRKGSLRHRISFLRHRKGSLRYRISFLRHRKGSLRHRNRCLRKTGRLFRYRDPRERPWQELPCSLEKRPPKRCLNERTVARRSQRR